MFKSQSWKQKLDKEYREAMNSGDIKKMDKANEIINQALDRFYAEKRRIK